MLQPTPAIMREGTCGKGKMSRCLPDPGVAGVNGLQRAFPHDDVSDLRDVTTEANNNKAGRTRPFATPFRPRCQARPLASDPVRLAVDLLLIFRHAWPPGSVRCVQQK